MAIPVPPRSVERAWIDRVELMSSRVHGSEEVLAELGLAHLGERCSQRAAAGAFAAYITGNVASNLLGRLMSATLADLVGLSNSFQAFAALKESFQLLGK